MIFLQPNWIIAFVCAYIFYSGAKLEAQQGTSRSLGLLWAAISLVVSGILIHSFYAGWFMVLVSQVVLFFAIGMVRAMRA